MPSIFLVPRWSGRSTSDWYPWLIEQVQASWHDRISDVYIFDYPDPDAPDVTETAAALTTAFDRFRTNWTDLVLVGHSVGCQALLRALARSGMTSPARGLVCVAGWWDIDEPWPSIRPWIDRPYDPRRALPASGPCRVLLSDNDPFTRDWQKNRAQWETRLDAEVQIIPGAKHFNSNAQPAVLEAIIKMTTDSTDTAS